MKKNRHVSRLRSASQKMRNVYAEIETLIETASCFRKTASCFRKELSDQ